PPAVGPGTRSAGQDACRGLACIWLAGAPAGHRRGRRRLAAAAAGQRTGWALTDGPDPPSPARRAPAAIPGLVAACPRLVVAGRGGAGTAAGPGWVEAVEHPAPSPLVALVPGPDRRRNPGGAPGCDVRAAPPCHAPGRAGCRAPAGRGLAAFP